MSGRPTMAETCTVPGCSRRRMARGWCSTHYGRWWRNGDVDALAPVTRAGDVGTLLAEFDGRITYRVFDHWCREGVIVLACQPAGPGDRRSFTPAEAQAVRAVIVEYEAINARLDALRSGRCYLAALAEAEADLEELAS